MATNESLFIQAAQEENFESSPQRYHVMDGTKNIDYVKSHRFQKTEFDQTLQRVLEGINFDRTDDRVLVNFSCRASSTDNVASQNKNIPEWALCGDILYRQEILRQSTFSLIIYEAGVTSSFNFQLRLSEALKEGPIPVIICVNIDCDIIRRQSMPFSEVIDYKQLVLFLPAPRLPELHFILRSWSDSDLSKARHTGRLIWQTYLGSSSTVTLTLLNTIRNRLGLPPAPFESAASPQVFNSTLMPIIMDHHKMKLPNAEEQEFLGPIGRFSK
jgi:alpha-1,4-N-acetylglucosaminyltransferase EXTL3